MTAREILAYAITHAPRGQKGGPYEGCGVGEEMATLALAQRYGDAADAHEDASWLMRQGHSARVIRIVRAARPSEKTTKAERQANTERLRIVGKNLCGLLVDISVASRADIGQRVANALREINSFLPADSHVPVPAVDDAPSEAEAVAVLRELVAAHDAYDARDEADDLGDLDALIPRARRVLAGAGPDPMPVVWAAVAWRDWGGEGTPWKGLAKAVDAYRKAGGK